MSCDQCQMLCINGVPCHEMGCPNANSVACALCGQSVRRVDVHHANDWDGICYCRSCAEGVARDEAEREQGESDL